MRMLDIRSDQLRNLVTLSIEKHGIRAPSAAHYEALKARRSGDDMRAATWEEVAVLAAAALAADPDG